jgi:hypothetical protein
MIITDLLRIQWFKTFNRYAQFKPLTGMSLSSSES